MPISGILGITQRAENSLCITNLIFINILSLFRGNLDILPISVLVTTNENEYRNLRMFIRTAIRTHTGWDSGNCVDRYSDKYKQKIVKIWQYDVDHRLQVQFVQHFSPVLQIFKFYLKIHLQNSRFLLRNFQRNVKFKKYHTRTGNFYTGCTNY